MANYWAERQAKTQANLTSKNIKDTQEQLRKYYAKTMQTVIADFEATYDKLQNAMANGKEPTPADLYKLDKYWQMQGKLKEELQKLGDKQAELMSKKFEEQYIDVYESLALKGSNAFNTVSKEAAQQMINQIWCADGKSWSSRVWSNTDKLQQSLNDNLIDCVVSGKKTTELKRKLMEQFNVSYNRADSIVRTEMAHIQTQAAQQRYKDYGIQTVEVWVDEDERTCPVCAKHEGEKYPVNARMPVPFHPRCRCCMIPVIDDNEIVMEDKNMKENTCIKCGAKIEANKKYCDNCAKILDDRWKNSVKKAGFTYDANIDDILSTPQSDEIFEYNYGYKGNNDNLMYICIDCGKPFFTKNKKSTAQKRCPDCQAKYRKKYKAEKEKERRAKQKAK